MGLSCSVDCLSIILAKQEACRNVCGFVVVWFGLVLGFTLVSLFGFGVFFPKTGNVRAKAN